MGLRFFKTYSRVDVRLNKEISKFSKLKKNFFKYLIPKKDDKRALYY